MKKTLFFLIMALAVISACKKEENLKPEQTASLLIKASTLEEYPMVVTKGDQDVVIGIFRHSGNSSDLTMGKLRVNLAYDGIQNTGTTPASVTAGIEDVSLWLKSNNEEILIGRNATSMSGYFTGATFLEEDCRPMVLKANNSDQLIVCKMKVKKNIPSGVKITASIDGFDFLFYNKELDLTVTNPNAGSAIDIDDVAASSPIIFVSSIPKIELIPVPEVAHGKDLIPFMSFAITAGPEGDITIASLRFHLNSEFMIYDFALYENGEKIGIINKDSWAPEYFISHLYEGNKRIYAGTTKVFTFCASVGGNQPGPITLTLEKTNYQAPCTNTFKSSINWNDDSMFLGGFYFTDLSIEQKVYYYPQ